MLEGAENFRDMTAIPCAGGRVVRPGRLLRSGQLSHLTAADLQRLAAYRVGLVCDLRSSEERALAPNRWPAAAPTLTADGPVASDPDAVRPSSWQELLADPAFDAAAARAHMIEGYRKMPRGFAAVLSGLFAYLDREDDSAALIHCVAGKDRTGFVCAMVL